MNCPFCGKDMTAGFVQSARQIFFAERPHENWFRADTQNADVVLSVHNWTRPTCNAYYCIIV